MADLASIADLPRWHPPIAVLDLAELVLTGVLTHLPAGLPRPPQAGRVVLEDAEGTPVAIWDVGGRPELVALQPFAHGPLRAARRSPQQVHAQIETTGGVHRGVLAVPLTGSLTTEEVARIEARAATRGEQILWLAVIGDGRTRDLPPAALWRAAQDLAGVPALLVLPIAPDGDDEALIGAAARAMGGTDVWFVDDRPPARPELPELPEPVAGMHPVFELELQRMASPARYPGATVFFTGLSGSGKSTVAKALAERIESGTSGRTVSLLDGDEVRRMLSAGLGFSRADRDLNILRIGFVAAEVTRHGGLAVCAPIAPFEQTRQQVRARVSAAGEFVLVHVNTPLAECERRDRKGLYAKARAGEIPEFTGISSPYEEPADADLRLDTSALSVDDAVEQVLDLMIKRGLLP